MTCKKNYDKRDVGWGGVSSEKTRNKKVNNKTNIRMKKKIYNEKHQGNAIRKCINDQLKDGILFQIK